MAAIYAIIPAAQASDLDAAFAAMLYGPGVFTGGGRLTSDPSPTTSSPTTHYAMYNAAASPVDFSAYSAAKAGTALPLDVNGDPVAWGVGGLITEAAAFAAFAALQLWANNSDEDSGAFAAGRRAAMGLLEVPPEL